MAEDGSRGTRIRQRLRTQGFWALARSYRFDRTDDVVRRLFRRHLHPLLLESNRVAALQTMDPRAILSRLPFPASGDSPGEEAEYRAAASALASRYDNPLAYKTSTAFSEGGSSLLYSITRRMRPTRILETGVANGHSSFLLLSALAGNGGGGLTSVDLSPDVGSLVPAALRSSWDLRLLPLRTIRAAFESVVLSLPRLDLFLHDSDHSYDWQRFEFRTAWPKISPGGILASDDVDWSYAFIDFAREVGVAPLVLVTENKAFGLIVKPGAYSTGSS